MPKPSSKRVVDEEVPRQRLTSRLASMTPVTLSGILKRAESGDVADWADLCDRMVQIDGHVRANYETRTAAVTGARWEITAGASGDELRDAHAVAGAELADRLLRDEPSFNDGVSALADGIGVGYGVAELRWLFSDDAWRVGFDWIHPNRFAFDAAWQLTYDDGDGAKPLSHWPDKFACHEPQARPGYPGVSGCLRPVAWMYLFKRWATQFWVTGAERFAWPIMVGEVERNATAEVRAKMQLVLDNVSSDHSVVVESEQAMRYLESQLKDSGTWNGLTSYLNGEISKAILGSVDQTEPAKVGAWKAVESRKGTTVDSRTAIDARQLEATVRGQVLEPLMRHNAHRFGGVVPATPRIRWVVAEQRQEIPATYIAAGVVTNDELRQRAGLEPKGGAWGMAYAGVEPDPTPLPSGNSARPSARRK